MLTDQDNSEFSDTVLSVHATFVISSSEPVPLCHRRPSFLLNIFCVDKGVGKPYMGGIVVLNCGGGIVSGDGTREIENL